MISDRPVFQTSKGVKLIVFLVLLLFLILPLPSAESPDWTIAVIDRSGRPVCGVEVRESFQNYSAEMEDHEETLTTGPSGVVRFPYRRLWRPLGGRVPLILLSAMGGVHASFGPSATAFIFGRGLDGDVIENGHIYFWRGTPRQLRSTIIAGPHSP